MAKMVRWILVKSNPVTLAKKRRGMSDVEPRTNCDGHDGQTQPDPTRGPRFHWNLRRVESLLKAQSLEHTSDSRWASHFMWTAYAALSATANPREPITLVVPKKSIV